jgi:hypothetical protein
MVSRDSEGVLYIPLIESVDDAGRATEANRARSWIPD